MYDDLPEHLRGDRTAGRSLTYEALWRCRLMLRLRASDQLLLYSGEDATICLHDGARVYYQVKSSTKTLGKEALEEFFSRAERGLAEEALSSFVLCTNAAVTGAYEARLNALEKLYPKRIQLEEWKPDSDYPTDKIISDLWRKVASFFKPRRVEFAIRQDKILDCCDRLVALEAKIKLQDSPRLSGGAIWEQIGLKALLDELPTAVLGGCLLNLPTWKKKSLEDAADPNIAEAIKAYGSYAISTGCEEDVLASLTRWIENPERSKILVVSGASGTGKTWLLTRLALRLDGQAPVYWADDLCSGSPKIEALAPWENRPTVLLVDNFEGEWRQAAIAALTSHPPVFIVATTAKPIQANAGLPTRINSDPIEFGPLLSEAETLHLIQNLRGNIITNDEKVQLRATNIRYACKLLQRRQTRSDLVRHLYSLWRQSETQAWVEPLIFCSSLRLRIPRSLLRVQARQAGAAVEMPEEVWPLALRIRVECDELLWIEDSDLAKELLENIELEAGSSSLEYSIRNALKVMIDMSIPEMAPHRNFVRRLFFELVGIYPDSAKRLLKEHANKVESMLSLESQVILANVWLPLLASVDEITQAKRAAQEFLCKTKKPASVCDILLLLYTVGNDRLTELLRAELRETGEWDVEPWALFIESLNRLNEESKRDLFRSSIRALMAARIDLRRLFRQRNVLVQFISLTRKYGLPLHRDWVVDMVGQFLGTAPAEVNRGKQHFIPQYLRLVSRCLMQRRSMVSIAITNELFLVPASNERAAKDLFGKSYDDYSFLYETELHDGRRQTALETALAMARLEEEPNKANNLWVQILYFSSMWLDSLSNDKVVNETQGFVSSLLEKKLPLNIYFSIAQHLAYYSVRKGALFPDGLTLILRMVDLGKGTCEGYRLFPLLLCLSAKLYPATAFIGKEAREVLKRLASCQTWSWDTYATYLQNLRLALGLKSDSANMEIEARAIRPDKQGGLQELFYGIGNVQWSEADKELLAESLFSRWKAVPRFRRPLLLTLFRLNAEKHAREIIDNMLSTRNDTDSVLFACSYEARFGDPLLAESYMKEVQLLYAGRAAGGHLTEISRAYADLAACSSGPKREILIMCSVLSREGLLIPPSELTSSGFD